MKSDAASLMRTRDVLAFVVLGAAVGLPSFAAAPVGASWLGAATLLLGLALAVLSAIDVQTKRLPDALTLPLIAAGLALSAIVDRDALAWHAAGAGLGYLSLWAVARTYLEFRGHPGLGLGDAKMFAAAGAWLGPTGLPNVLLVAAFGALAGVGVARLSGIDVSARTAIPFGPFLALGFWATWLYGPLA